MLEQSTVYGGFGDVEMGGFDGDDDNVDGEEMEDIGMTSFGADEIHDKVVEDLVESCWRGRGRG